MTLNPSEDSQDGYSRNMSNAAHESGTLLVQPTLGSHRVLFHVAYTVAATTAHVQSRSNNEYFDKKKKEAASLPSGPG
jgi:hypothetical protein